MRPYLYAAPTVAEVSTPIILIKSMKYNDKIAGLTCGFEFRIAAQNPFFYTCRLFKLLR